MKFMLCILIFSLSLEFGLCQTCCSSGVPIASNIGFQSKGKRILQISMGYEHNNLQYLFSESELLQDNNRLRTTNTILGRLSYGITEKFNIETLIPYVSQNRWITQNNDEVNYEGGSGFGDITIMPQIDLLDKDFSTLSLGLGLKFPTGSNNVRNSDGFLIVNDLQLGSNAYDFIAKASYFLLPKVRPTSSFFLNSTYVFRGTDKEYLGSQTYKFGNEVQFNLGISDQLFLFDRLIIPSLAFRSRYAVNDQIGGNKLANTGGFWVFVNTGIMLDIYKGHRLSVNSEIPIFTRVDGTQLSPSYIINVSYYKTIDFNSVLESH